MPVNKPQPNYSKRPTRKVRLPKMGLRKPKSLLEEYFHGFVVAIFAVVTLLLIAGGMDSSDALVMGLWIAGITWFAWQVRKYFKEKSNPTAVKKPAPAAKTPNQVTKIPLSPNLKPMIGPQWPLKVEPGPSSRPAPGGGQAKKPVFVYERPTLPDRKPKLPANWPGRQDKKPKQ